jgi:hypothetical protein
MGNDGVTIPPAQAPDDDPPLCPNCGYPDVNADVH